MFCKASVLIVTSCYFKSLIMLKYFSARSLQRSLQTSAKSGDLVLGVRIRGFLSRGATSLDAYELLLCLVLDFDRCLFSFLDSVPIY